MKILLVAVNAKYIHSNLAVYSLKAYAASKGYEIDLVEYTINQQQDEVLRDLYGKNADVVAFSCYIWNIEFVKTLLRDYKKVRPQSEIWLGGPEVSYRGEQLLQEFPEVRGIMVGEGEATFTKLVEMYRRMQEESVEEQLIHREMDWNNVPGIVMRDNHGEIFGTAPAPPLDFSMLPFPYGQEIPEAFENRIVYYESSRGCPFSCAYCLSSVDKKVRFRNVDLVKQELAFFLEQKVPQVKFIDRTFNVNGSRTMQLLQFIKDNDNGITNFHFEIAAELLTQAQIKLLRSLRPGLVQLEIGVQSVNEETLHAVQRKNEIAVLKKNVAAIREKNNVHIHLDLIAGLPQENLCSFRHSFDEVYDMKPHQLQLGFLKVLSGAPMEKMTSENEIVYQGTAPYEVLSTKWLSFDDMILLKKVEEMVEVYYNSGQFVYSMMYLRHFFESSFSLYEKLADYYEEKKYAGRKLSRNKRYEILLEFVKEQGTEKEKMSMSVFEQILFYDYCLREKPKSGPTFFERNCLEKAELKELYSFFDIKREEEGMYDIEQFSFEPEESAECGKEKGKPCYILFSYGQREAMYGNAYIKKRCDRK